MKFEQKLFLMLLAVAVSGPVFAQSPSRPEEPGILDEAFDYNDEMNGLNQSIVAATEMTSSGLLFAVGVQDSRRTREIRSLRDEMAGNAATQRVPEYRGYINERARVSTLIEEQAASLRTYQIENSPEYLPNNDARATPEARAAYAAEVGRREAEIASLRYRLNAIEGFLPDAEVRFNAAREVELARILRGELNDGERAIARALRGRLAGRVVGILGLAGLADGASRSIALVNGRDPGSLPGVSLTSVLVKRGSVAAWEAGQAALEAAQASDRARLGREAR